MDQLRQGEHYFAITSGATPGGNLGNELWVTKDLSWSDDKKQPLQVRPKDCTVAYADERILLVTIRTKRMALDVLVAHFPNQWDGGAHSREYIVRLGKILAKRANLRVPLLLLADTNITVGEVVSSAFEHFAAERPAATLEELAELLERLDVVLPATFEQCATPGRQTTLQDNKGNLRRVDFVLRALRLLLVLP